MFELPATGLDLSRSAPELAIENVMLLPGVDLLVQRLLREEEPARLAVCAGAAIMFVFASRTVTCCFVQKPDDR